MLKNKSRKKGTPNVEPDSNLPKSDKNSGVQPPPTITTPTVSAPFAPPVNPAESNTGQSAPVPQSFSQSQSDSSAPAQNIAASAVNSPGLIVLQWLTYAFWGWTVLTMCTLTVSVLANFITGAETGGFTPYAIAAVLVLLPISIACDVFYSKQEPQKKAGAASIVMVIHAVLFAIFCIGAVIAIVFSLVSMLTSSSDPSGKQVFLYSAMIITVLYAAVFLRTINPHRLTMIRRFFIIFMTVVVGIIAVLGVVGPVAHERATRNDKLITSNLNSLKSQIDSYADKSNKLPDSLNDLELTGDTKALVEKDLVEYTPNTQQPATSYTRPYTSSKTKTETYSRTTYYYQLCVNYAKKFKTRYGNSYARSDSDDGDGYLSYLNVSSNHDAGEKCYKVKATDNNY